MIRWNEPEGQGGDVQLASLDTSVLRYDGQGQLIVPVRPELVEGETREMEGAEAAADVSYSTKGVAAPRDVLPSIRLIATRYQDHPALKRFQLLLNRQGFPRGLVCDSSCSGGSRDAQTLVCRYSRPLPEAF